MVENKKQNNYRNSNEKNQLYKIKRVVLFYENNLRKNLLTIINPVAATTPAP